MQSRLVPNKNGIPKVIPLKPPILGRKCIVPWIRDGGGKKDKRAFTSRDSAQAFIANHLKGDPELEAYKCKSHGWHIGHNRHKEAPAK